MLFFNMNSMYPGYQKVNQPLEIIRKQLLNRDEYNSSTSFGFMPKHRDVHKDTRISIFVLSEHVQISLTPVKKTKDSQQEQKTAPSSSTFISCAYIYIYIDPLGLICRSPRVDL